MQTLFKIPHVFEQYKETIYEQIVQSAYDANN
jgi:hypothetical protein